MLTNTRTDGVKTDQGRPAVASGMKVLHWNVNGLRAVTKNVDVEKMLLSETPDVVALTEAKLPNEPKSCDPEFAWKYYPYRYYNGGRPGYASTVLWCKTKPLAVTFGIPMCRDKQIRTDAEGRVIVADFGSWVLVVVYTPNAGQNLKRLEWRTKTWDPAFRRYMVRLGKTHGASVVVVGDLNCARCAMDIHSPEKNNTSAGYTTQERKQFELLLRCAALRDVWRDRNPDEVRQYTYWSYRTRARQKNAGWRIDYALVGAGIDCRACELLCDQQGSDHCPLTVVVSPKPAIHSDVHTTS